MFSAILTFILKSKTTRAGENNFEEGRERNPLSRRLLLEQQGGGGGGDADTGDGAEWRVETGRTACSTDCDKAARQLDKGNVDFLMLSAGAVRCP